MFDSIKMSEHKQWDGFGLKEYSAFADKITEFNMVDMGDCSKGEWYFIDDDVLQHPTEEHLKFRVIYGGTWGNDNSPGADCYTWAELFDADDEQDMHEFEKRVKKLQSKPEWKK